MEMETAKQHRVLVFTTPTCPWCSRAKSFLRESKIPYKEIDVSKDRRAAADLVKRSGQMGVPVIEIDGRIVIGFDQKKISQLLGLKQTI